MIPQGLAPAWRPEKSRPIGSRSHWDGFVLMSKNDVSHIFIKKSQMC
jgi:hypothetical protein